MRMKRYLDREDLIYGDVYVNVYENVYENIFESMFEQVCKTWKAHEDRPSSGISSLSVMCPAPQCTHYSR